MTSVDTRHTASPSPTLVDRWPARVAGGLNLTLLAMLAQAVLAGSFVDKHGQEGLVTAHGIVADVTWVVALLTAAAAAVTLRRAQPRLVAWTTGLFALTLVQTGIGHWITDYGHDSWIAVHVPLAVVLFGLGAWLSLRFTGLSRQVTSPGAAQAR